MSNKDEKQKAPVEIYTPPNKLAEAIGEGSGPSLREMQQDAERRLRLNGAKYRETLKASIEEMKEHVASDASGVDVREAIFALAHDIKGQAPLFDYHLVAEVAVCICTAIHDVPEKLQARPDLLVLHVHSMAWAFEHIDDASKEVEKAALVQSLHEALES